MISLTISETTQSDNRTPNGITVTGNSFVVSGTSASVYGNFDAQGSATESITIDLGRGSGDDRISIEAYLDTSIEIAPEETALAIGSASYTLQNIYARYVDSGIMIFSNSQDTNGDIISIDGNTVAGVILQHSIWAMEPLSIVFLKLTYLLPLIIKFLPIHQPVRYPLDGFFTIWHIKCIKL